MPLEQVGECCCRGPCSPQGLSPLKQGILSALEKPLQGAGQELEAAGDCAIALAITHRPWFNELRLFT